MKVSSRRYAKSYLKRVTGKLRRSELRVRVRDSLVRIRLENRTEQEKI
jgi:hypothetical protein